jgi:FkbM family methyltransferase
MKAFFLGGFLLAVSSIQGLVVNGQNGFGNCNFRNNGEAENVKRFLKDGGVFFDVGANLGHMTNIAVSSSANVSAYAFEPIEKIFSRLICNVPKSVNTYLMAVDRQEGSRQFYEWGDEECINGAGAFYYRDVLLPHFKGVYQTLEVPTVSIDAFWKGNNLDYIDYLKIDVEGGEEDVIMGAIDMIERNKIGVVHFEYGSTFLLSNITLKGLYGFFLNRGYVFYRICPTGLIEISEWKVDLENYEYANYIAILPKIITDEIKKICTKQ